MVRPWTALALAALLPLTPGCPEGDDDAADPGDDDVADELDLSGFIATVVRTQDGPFYDLAWIDEQRLAAVEITEEGEFLCPDCATMPPEDCPEECERDHLDLWLLDHDGAALGEPTRQVTYFPPAFDHDLSGAQVVAWDDGSLGLAWQECDNSVCGGVFSARSCTTRYRRVDPDGAPLTDPATLIEGWFGDVALAADPAGGRLLVVYSTMVGCYSGVLAATFDPDGAPLSAFTPLGSVHGNVPAPALNDGAFVIAIDDPEHGGPAATPCATSCECDCGAMPSTSGEDAGVSAYWLDGAGAATREVVTTSAAGDAVAWHQQLQLASAGETLVLAGVPSSLPVTIRQRDDQGGWPVRAEQEPPGSLWFDLRASEAGDAWWLGSEAADPEDYLLTRLVVGAARADGVTGRGPVEDPLRGYVFDFAVTGGVRDDGGARVFALRGVFPAESTGEWERFEIVRVDAPADWTAR